MKNKFLSLWLAGLVGTAAVLPYAFTLQHDILSKTGQPLAVMVITSIVQTAVLLAIAIFLGLKLTTGLNLPIFAPFDANSAENGQLSRFLQLTISAGMIVAVLITLGDKIFGQFLPQLVAVNGQVAIWKTLLAALYGGIVEEILMRLFVMSLLAWIIAKIFKVAEPAKNNLLMWAAIIISSVLFGLGHLPITAALTAITPLVVLRAIVLNGIGGLVFGWLFWKKGLIYGMAAHFTADIFLLAVLPAIIK